MKHLESIINEGKNLINNSEYNHLPLPFRNKLLKAIDNGKIIGRLSIICALKVLPIWNKCFPEDNEIIKLLKEIENYNSGKDLFKNAEKIKTFIENKNNGENFNALYSGYAAVNAAYEVTGKYIDENKDNDFQIDSSEWDSVFYAFLAFTGGAKSFKEINKNKARIFWNWYLEEAIQKAYSNDILIKIKINKESLQKEFSRTKYEKINNDKNIMGKINEIENVILKNITHENIELKVYLVGDTRMVTIHTLDKKEKIGINYETGFEIDNKVMELKNEIYNMNKDEGTFYLLKLKLENQNKKIEYIYDRKDEELKNLNIFSDEIFINDFKEYPRKKEYVPKWLLKILERNNIIK